MLLLCIVDMSWVDAWIHVCVHGWRFTGVGVFGMGGSMLCYAMLRYAMGWDGWDGVVSYGICASILPEIDPGLWDREE